MKARTRIGLREVRQLGPGEIFWDAAVPGFGARRQNTDAVSYVLLYRTAGRRQRWHTIGRHGAPWTPHTARAEARRLLGEVAMGADPAGTRHSQPEAITVTELCDRYWADVTAGRVLVRGGKPKKPSTVASDIGRIEGHIKPLLGRLSVAALTRDDVSKFMHSVAAGETATNRKTKPRGRSIIRGGKGVATRSIGLLGAILAYAVEKGIRIDNPARGIRKYAENKRERRLTEEEYKRLGVALTRAGEASIWPPAVALIRFLALTGWRRGEAIDLRWTEVDLATRTARLTNTKTGASMRPLSLSACDLLAGLTRGRDRVFPPSKGEGAMGGVYKFWRRVATLGNLPGDISPHVFRHSFASLAADLGYSEPTIAALIGHKGQTMTARYVHSADAVLLAAADAVARETSMRMGDQRPAVETVPIRASRS